MELSAEVFWAPKRGLDPSEYEDAFAPADSGQLSGTRFAFAIADGATEATFSKLWANALVTEYARTPHDAWTNIAERAAATWDLEVATKVLPWFAAEKAREGSFAAFLGLSLLGEGPSPHSWSAVAIGDCCLFQIRRDALLRAFPLDRSEQFSSSPMLAPTQARLRESLVVQFASGECVSDDSLLLMSDALACWFLAQAERGMHPWHIVRDLGTVDAPAFEIFIANLRASGELRNDDCTLLRVDIHL